jgi:DNA repair and recombination protein RAD54B
VHAEINAKDAAPVDAKPTSPQLSEGASGSKKPLLLSKTLTINVSPKKDENSAVGEERYFNVLWRKPTNKKHKTWGGDGFLRVSESYAYLQDSDGRSMGKIMVTGREVQALEPGSALKIGGKDVEIDSVVEKEAFMAGRVFLGASVAGAKTSAYTRPNALQKGSIMLAKEEPAASMDVKASHRKLNVAAPKSIAVKSGFKTPMKQSADTGSSVHTSQSMKPRHDPLAPNALVMKRPSHSNVPKGKQIVDVVIDPFLSQHLRQHQREGVKFLYECCMGMRRYAGDGAILADEMGLGKTLQTITLLWTLLKQNPLVDEKNDGRISGFIKKALIVCPVTLINNWRKEFRKWLGNERIGILVADGAKVNVRHFTKGSNYRFV